MPCRPRQPQCNTLSVHRLDTLALEDSVTASSGSGQGDAHFESLSPYANVVLAFGDLATAAGRNWLHEYTLGN